MANVPGHPDRYDLQLRRPIRRRRVRFVRRDFTDKDEKEDQALITKYHSEMRLYTCRQELSRLLDDKIFLANSLAFVSSKINGGWELPQPLNLNYVGTNERLTEDEEMQKIKTRISDTRLTFSTDTHTLRSLTRYLISQNLGAGCEEFPEIDTPNVLFRAFNRRNHTRYDDRFGFRSSRQPFTLPDPQARGLKGSALVTADMLRKHCEGREPSDLIALSDSLPRIFNIISCWDFKDMAGDCIAVMDVSKLIAAGVLINRTTTLAMDLGVQLRSSSNPEGLPFANPNYWVAYRWVPAECIAFCTSTSNMRDVCKQNNIGDKDYSTKITLQELQSSLPLAKLQDLSLN
ncbi:hypothetical protein AJ78_03795 [Emergomyces pasteurianus Ep9510]|uniref:DUF7587 domain-containing protein n=1 Tax=Emergomyces pasteurianus Ep9510 TaxID=1447872 RepID=A0A1J9Q6Y7_9EURO|nr:hypothetical protein AJ78_03795 [Emergomyces pasteurianus Ep9510]